MDFCRESRETLLWHAQIKDQDQSQGKLGICVPVVVHHITLTQLPQEVLVVGDDDELEVGMVLSFIDDTNRGRQTSGMNSRRVTHSTRLDAKASIFSVSRALVGSSNARIPQFWPNESARASRMMIDASIF